MRKHPAKKAPPAGPKPAPVPRACPAAVSDDAEREIGRLSRRSLLRGVVPVGAALLGWRWLITRREDNGLPWPFRRALEINEQLARDYYRTARLSPAFPRSLAAEPRPNGDEGMSDDFDPERWMLRVEGLATSDGQSETPITLSLDAIKALPRTDVVTELRCIEGWSQVVHWAGARFLDFARKYPPATRTGDPPDVIREPEKLVEYVRMATPDGGYYVGIDMASALHPQTLLCYELNGKPLTLEHGAPLRLVIPVKYGIKSIKRIGTITFTNQRPSDYWAERGYDWYAGH